MDIGTRLVICFRAVQVGSERAGKRYFHERRTSGSALRRRRWVRYAGTAEASSVPPEWHAWLHYTTDEPLPQLPHYAWQKTHQPNLTGTPAAYRPAGHDHSGGQRAAADGDYESWAPTPPDSAGAGATIGQDGAARAAAVTSTP